MQQIVQNTLQQGALQNTGHTGPSTAKHATPLVTMQQYSDKQVPHSDILHIPDKLYYDKDILPNRSEYACFIFLN
jgi:hypothetical protein